MALKGGEIDINKFIEMKVIKDLHIEVYDTVINVLIADTVYKALKQIDCHKEKPREFWDSAKAVFNISPNNGCWALAFANDRVSVSTIAHECGHLAFAILKSKGVVYCHKSEEAFTYLLGYLVEKVTEIIINAGIEISLHQRKPIAASGTDPVTYK